MRGPFLAEVTETSIVIAWSTDLAGTGEVEYGLQAAQDLIVEEAPSKEHAVPITGLAPGESYVYLVRTSGNTLASGLTFQTARPSSDPRLRFVAFGDSGSGSEAQFAVASLVRGADPDLAILTGDIVYENGEAANFDPHYFEPYADLIDHIPFYTTLGNHDVRTGNGEPYLEAFHLPHDNPESTERYYSFETAGVLFVALDSNESAAEGSPMRVWLAETLARPASWKFVFFHHPIFSSGPHGSALDLRAELEPLLDAAGVDIVFCGHDHDYERTFPLKEGSPVSAGQEPTYTSPGGVIYIVTGGGGRSLYAKETENSFTAALRSVYHMVLVDIDGPALTLSGVDIDGNVFDSISLAKG